MAMGMNRRLRLGLDEDQPDPMEAASKLAVAQKLAEPDPVGADMGGVAPVPGVSGAPKNSGIPTPTGAVAGGVGGVKVKPPVRQPAGGVVTPGVVTAPGEVGGRETGAGAGAAPDDNGVADAAADTGVPAPDLEWRNSLGYGDQGTLIGFRQDGYGGDAEEANTVKNTFAKLASRYNHAPSQVDALLQDPDFRRAFPNATKVEGGANDKIDFGGVLSFFDHGEPVGVVDVQKAADPGADVSEGWTWQPEGGGGGVDAAMGGGAAGGGINTDLGSLTESDQLAEIMAQIDALANGRNLDEIKAMQGLLNGGV